MANVKITALNHISSTQIAPEDVFVIDDVSQLITYKVTLSNVTRYMSNVVNVGVVANLDAFAAYANANAAALANAISNVSPNLTLSDGSNTDILTVGVDTLRVVGSNGVGVVLGDNELRISMSNTGVAGTYGGGSGSNYTIPSLTLNEQGRVVSAQNVSISIDFSGINTVSSNVDTVSANVSNIINGTTQFTGPVTFQDNITADRAILNTQLQIGSNVTSNVGTSNTAIFTFSGSTYRGAELLLMVQDITNSQYQLSKMLVVHNGTIVDWTEYGIVTTGDADLTSFTASIDGSQIVTVNSTGGSVNKKITVASHYLIQ